MKCNTVTPKAALLENQSMKLSFVNSSNYNGRKAATLLAENEAEEKFLIEVLESFRSGCVTIEAKNHKPQTACLECLSQQRYKDCVTGSATLGMENVLDASSSIVKV